MWKTINNFNKTGGGLLVDMMKRAVQNKQYAEIDHAIKTKVEPFLYNKGKGRYCPISHIVLLRNKERPRHKLVSGSIFKCFKIKSDVFLYLEVLFFFINVLVATFKRYGEPGRRVWRRKGLAGGDTRRIWCKSFWL